MKRSKPVRSKQKLVKDIADEKKKVQAILERISNDWNADERETSILFDHNDKLVYLETSYPSTARRWFKNLWGDPNVKFDTRTDSLKITVPWQYCRKPDLIVKAKYREFDG